MKRVTVYELVGKDVVMYDGQDVYEYCKMPMEVVEVINGPDKYLDKEHLKYEKINLPVIRYCKVGQGDFYICWDKPVLELLQIEEEQVKNKLAKKDQEIDNLRCAVFEWNDKSPWELFKIALKKIFT